MSRGLDLSIDRLSELEGRLLRSVIAHVEVTSKPLFAPPSHDRQEAGATSASLANPPRARPSDHSPPRVVTVDILQDRNGRSAGTGARAAAMASGEAMTDHGAEAAGAMPDHQDMAMSVHDMSNPMGTDPLDNSMGESQPEGHRRNSAPDHGSAMHETSAASSHHPVLQGTDGKGPASHHGSAASASTGSSEAPSQREHEVAEAGSHGFDVALDVGLDVELLPSTREDREGGMQAGHGSVGMAPGPATHMASVPRPKVDPVPAADIGEPSRPELTRSPEGDSEFIEPPDGILSTPVVCGIASWLIAFHFRAKRRAPQLVSHGNTVRGPRWLRPGRRVAFANSARRSPESRV